MVSLSPTLDFNLFNNIYTNNFNICSWKLMKTKKCVFLVKNINYIRNVDVGFLEKTHSVTFFDHMSPIFSVSSISPPSFN